MSYKITCFGEVLWDVLPGGKMAGGAPLNVAYHLKKLGIDSHIISRVGADEDGTALLGLLDSWKIANHCQVDSRIRTGVVLASMEPNFEVNYDIVFPAAWDFVEMEENYLELVRRSDAFVFGSLIMRNEISKNTLNELLSGASYRIFDVNLRPPYYAPEQVMAVLRHTDLLKLNKNELDIIGQWAGLTCDDEKGKIKALMQGFAINEVLVTRGKDGATYYMGNESYDCPLYKVEVADTVGSGDAFLAGFLAKKLEGNGAKIIEQLDAAALMGAFVASQRGGCPAYEQDDLERMRLRNIHTNKTKNLQQFKNK